jgi:benzoyl-CoA reductase subunit D
MTTSESRTALTAGIDVGSSTLQVALVREGPRGEELVDARSERLRRRDPGKLAEELFASALAEHRITASELAYVATTGEGDCVPFRTGHFYGMTAHARGALFLAPQVRAVLDVGALHTRAVAIDQHGKVLGSRMTSQCASGSGQFLENICRYLGITLEEIGPLSLRSTRPEACSSICAVLAETDVINMVSRGVAAADIIKGIHQSMAGRYVKLLTSLGVRGQVLVTGGLAADVGLVEALREASVQAKNPLSIAVDERSAYAGAIGAALWGGFRSRKLGALGIALRPDAPVAEGCA